MILIKNGLIIENNRLVKKDILIEDNLIKQIEDVIDIDCEIIDASNSLVMPGAVDVHVHLREPGFVNKETIKTGTLSAAKGGITSIMSMPNLNPCPDSLQHLNVQLELIKKDACVNVYPFASVSVNEEDKIISDIDQVADSVYGLSDDGRGVNNLELLEEAMKKALKYNHMP